MSKPTKETAYPNDVSPQQIEDLIASAADLQRQVLRRYTQSVLEEMRYHLWVAQAKTAEAELQRDEAIAAKERAEAAVADWIYANGPDGWIERLRKDNDALAAKLAEAERDAERLDWIESDCKIKGSEEHWFDMAVKGIDLRSAIDAARGVKS